MPLGRIIGTGSALPAKKLTNQDIEKIVDTSDEWITTRTGIQCRYVSDAATATSDLAIAAANKALESAGMTADQLDLIIVATSTPDHLNFPSTACLVQYQLGARRAAAFDLSAACSGFVYSLTTADQFIRSGLYKNILVIGADTLTKYLNWEDRNTCVLFGDGAGAVILQTSENERYGVLSSYLAADGSGGDLLMTPAGGSRKPITETVLKNKEQYITMDGKSVFKFSIRVIVDGIEKALSLAGLTQGDIDLLIPHQANIRIINHAIEKLGLSPEKVCVNIQMYGNTSAATIPIALDEAVRVGRLKKDMVVVMMGFGGGLTWGSNVIRWG